MTRSSVRDIGHRHLYLCTPDRPDLAAFLAKCLSGGVDVVQLRDNTLADGDVVARGRVAAEVCADHGAPFIVNNRPDLAVEAGAEGVHVGQDDVPPASARGVVGPGAIVGLSTHAPAELAASRGEDVDYISAGPVVPTPTKPGRPGTGLGYVASAVAGAGRPVFVTGGVDPDSVPALVEAGARHFVVVRYLVEADDPHRAASMLRAAIDRHLGER